jgi:hypothetical protein
VVERHCVDGSERTTCYSHPLAQAQLPIRQPADSPIVPLDVIILVEDGADAEVPVSADAVERRTNEEAVHRFLKAALPR